MLRQSQAAVVARNETWRGKAATEPHEAGWAAEAIFFVTALADAEGDPGEARVQLSPDGMRWADEGSALRLPAVKDEVGYVRVARFGTWLRLVADMPERASLRVLVTLHLKA